VNPYVSALDPAPPGFVPAPGFVPGPGRLRRAPSRSRASSSAPAPSPFWPAPPRPCPDRGHIYSGI